MMLKYPEINVQLVGEDGNAFSIMGKVVKALRKAGVSAQEIVIFREQAMSGDYDNLLRIVMEWVNTDSKNNGHEDYTDRDEDWEYDI